MKLPIFVVILTIGTARAASAGPILYTYTGDLLDTLTGTAPADLSRVTFTMVANELGPNLLFDYDVRFVPLWWSISDGARTYTSNSVLPNASPQFGFATDSSGALTQWFLYLSFFNIDNPGGGSNYDEWNLFTIRAVNYNASGVPGSPFERSDRSLLCSAYNCDYGRPLDYLAVSSSQSGSWKVEQLPPAPVPEPSTLFLLGSGLAGILGARRRRKTAKPN